MPIRHLLWRPDAVHGSACAAWWHRAARVCRAIVRLGAHGLTTAMGVPAASVPVRRRWRVW